MIVVLCPTCQTRYKLTSPPRMQKTVPCPRCRGLIPLPEGKDPKGEISPEGFDRTVVTVSPLWEASIPEGVQISLAVLEGRDKGGRFPLRKVRTTIGRKGTDILLSDPEVSKLHAVITVTREGCTLKDLGSTNGTYLNGRKITEAPLSHLDEIWLGRTKLLFLYLQTVGDLTPIPEEGQEEKGIPAPKRVLVLGCSREDRRALADRLSKAGLEVITAEDGKAAETLFEQGLRPDLLILDLRLLGTDSPSLLRHLKEIRAKEGAPIVALTEALTPRELVLQVKGLEVSALHWLSNPPEDLLTTVTTLLSPGRADQPIPLAQANLDVLYQMKGEVLRGTILTLGRKGMSIRADRPGLPGMELLLQFVLPGIPRLFHVRSRLVRLIPRGAPEGPGMEVEFLGLDEETRSQLAAFILLEQKKQGGVIRR